MMVITSVINLSALAPLQIVCCGLREQRCSSLMVLYSESEGDSIQLAPEDVSLQQFGMLSGIKNVCLRLLTSVAMERFIA